MTKRQKRLERIRQNPKTVTFEELRQVLEDHWFILGRSVGSHHHFRAEVGADTYHLSVPYKRPYIKPAYVKQALEMIDIIADKLSETKEGNVDDDE
jgi:hypothetical protein